MDLSQFGPCSPKNSFGYNNSQPCIFLKLNKIYGWQPEFYDNPNELPEEMPQELKDYIGQKPAGEVSICYVLHSEKVFRILYKLIQKGEKEFLLNY